MTYEQISALEPLFGKWNVEDTVAQGKNTTVFKVSCYENAKRISRAIEAIKIPGSNEEISLAIESGRFVTVDEYLSFAEKTICENIEKMLAFSESRNIVNYYEYTVIKESNCFYVLILRELMTPLSEHIKDRRIKQKEAVKLGWDICNAIEEFRQAGIIHKHITTDNIFIGDNSSFKLGDFGIDSMYRKKSGTGSYKAPELFAGKESFSADIYALGMVLYRLMNNNRGPFLPEYPAPVSFEDRERASSRRLRGDMFPMPSNADSSLARIIFTATAYRPEERYASPLQMKEDIENYVKSALTESAQPKPVYVPEYEQKPERTDGAASVSIKDKAAFAEAFRDDEVTEEKSYKKWYILIGSLVVILSVMIGIIIGTISGKESTDADDIVFSPDYESTTQASTTNPTVDVTEPVTEESTTSEEESTTEELTTEEVTTEPITTEEPTTEEPTTGQDVTEDTTQEVTVPTNQQPDAGAIQPGDISSDGRVYTELLSCNVVFTPQSDDDKEVVVEIGTLKGSNPEIVKTAHIYMEREGYLILRSDLAASIVDVGEGSFICEFTVVDESFYYEPEEYVYYIVLPQGAIETDAEISMEQRIHY